MSYARRPDSRVQPECSRPKLQLYQPLHRYADAIREAIRLAGSEMHQAGLVGEVAVKLRRTGKATPRLDTQEGGGAELWTQSQFAKALPGHLDRRTRRCRVTHGRAGRPVQDDGIIVEQPLRQREGVACDRRRLRRRAEQTVLQMPNRRGFLV